jgi:hypothetical protein
LNVIEARNIFSQTDVRVDQNFDIIRMMHLAVVEPRVVGQPFSYGYDLQFIGENIFKLSVLNKQHNLINGGIAQIAVQTVQIVRLNFRCCFKPLRKQNFFTHTNAFNRMLCAAAGSTMLCDFELQYDFWQQD